MTTTLLPAPTRRDPLDLRLATGAVVAWLAVYGLLDRPAGAALTVAGVAGGLGVVAVIGSRVASRVVARPVRWLHVVGLVAFCVALAGLPLAGRLARAEASPLVALARAHAAVEVDVTVSADPTLLAAKGPAGAPRVAVETEADAVRSRGAATPVDGAVLVLDSAAAWRDVLPGQRVRLAGDLNPDLDGGVLSVTLFSRAPPQRLGVPPWWQRFAATVRTGLRTAARVLPDQERGLLPGLIDGDTANLDPVLAERFRLAGLTHLVAVSGASNP